MCAQLVGGRQSLTEGLGHSRSDVVHLICGPGNGPDSLVSPTALTHPSDWGREVLLLLVGSCDSWKIPTSHRSGHTVTLTHSRRTMGGADHMTGTREGLDPARTLDPNAPAAGRFVGTGDIREQATLLLLGKRGLSVAWARLTKWTSQREQRVVKAVWHFPGPWGKAQKVFLWTWLTGDPSRNERARIISSGSVGSRRTH